MANTRSIVTSLVDRDEVFRFLAVCEATRLPGLLKGDPGVGKTKALLDYGKGVYNQDMSAMMEKTFILETDEGTRSGDVKGRVDMKRLLQSQEYHVISPITSAKFILINEIDKANSGLRNSLLGIMNEGYLFNGQEKVACKWDVFLATCNKIPSEEKDNPFWDRFVLKMDVKRIGKAQMMKYYTNGAQKKTITIHVPTEDEIQAVVANLDRDKLEKFVNQCHTALSDRTLSYVPRLTAAVALVYKMPISRALVKCAEILVSYDAAKALGQVLEPKEIIELRSKIELIPTLSDATSLTTTLKDIEKRINALISSGTIDQSQVDELSEELKVAAGQNPILIAQQQTAAQQASVSQAMSGAFAPPVAAPVALNLGKALVAGTVTANDAVNIDF